MKSEWTAPALWILVFLLTVGIVMLVQTPPEHIPQRSYSQLIAMGPKLKSAFIRGDVLDGRDDTGARFAVRLPRDAALADRLAKDGAQVVVEEFSNDPSWSTTLLTNGLPMLFYAVVWLYPLVRIAKALEQLLADRAPATRTVP